MEDFEYIMRECRKSHYTQWNETVLEECVAKLTKLTREQLFSLYRSKWLTEKDPLREAAFKALFADKIGKREERIKNMETVALIEEFKDKKSGNVALIREELCRRYKEGKDRQMITETFNNSTKGDQQWVKSQMRKEREGGNNTYTGA